MKNKSWFKYKWNRKPYPIRMKKSSNYKGYMPAGYAAKTLRNAMSSSGLLKRARERIKRKKLVRKMNMVRNILSKSNTRKRSMSNGYTNTPLSKIRNKLSYNDNVVRSIAEYL